MNDGRTIQTSTIYISIGNKLSVYKSVDEIPPDVRKKLEKSTTGANSISILIADDRGREEIARAIGGLPTPVQSRIAGRLQARKEARVSPNAFWTSWKLWVEIALVGGAGLVVWLAFTWR
jgi:hypothetical protein